jgi:UDPglucose--hexose-1-phosphate uridylyltransferase
MAGSFSIRDLQEHPHKRYNPLTGEWIIVSPHRTKRPWKGSEGKTEQERTPSYDPHCYLCPGNTRAGGLSNPDYSDTYSFVNDFAALLPEVPAGALDEEGLFRAETERGICKVICFSPRHDLTMARMSRNEIAKVVQLWIGEQREIGALDYISYVQIFENRGALMGCSQPHPHGQIWSNEHIPDLPARETRMQADYFREHRRPLLLDYLEKELERKERVVYQNEDFAVLVPFWAVWPYETILLPKRHILSLEMITPAESASLAEAMRVLSIKYDNLFETSFPYSMGIHGRPCDGQEYPGWQLHLHYFPPLLRSATVKKFMVGYELLANPQRDLTAETSAETLRELPNLHYRDGKGGA